MSHGVCHLCGNAALERDLLPSESGGIRSAARVVCTTCGIYDVTMMLDVTLRTYSEEDRYRLSGITRRATERGETLELSTSSAPALLAETTTPDPIEQVDLVLAYLESNTSPGGPGAPLNPERDYTIAQALGPGGLQFVVASMLKDGLIEQTATLGVPHYRPTLPGYAKLKDRRHTASEAPIKTAWDKVDHHLKAAHERLQDASFEEDFQQAGLLCREALISLAQAVFDPQRHPTLDGVKASATDAKRMLEAVIATQLAGESNEEARSLAKAAVRLALALQHDRAADKRTASLCYEATAAVIRLVSVLTTSRRE
jgi:hypothetical protein